MNELKESTIQKKTSHKLVAIFLAVLAIIYIVNPGAGVIEFIPDNLPFVGNLDEATATAILIKCIYFLKK